MLLISTTPQKTSGLPFAFGLGRRSVRRNRTSNHNSRLPMTTFNQFHTEGTSLLFFRLHDEYQNLWVGSNRRARSSGGRRTAPWAALGGFPLPRVVNFLKLLDDLCGT